MLNRHQAKVLIVLTGIVMGLGSYSGGAEPTIAQLISEAGSGDEASRIRAIDRIAEHYNKTSAVEVLTKLLTDTSGGVRAHAAHALGKIGSPAKASVEPLSALFRDADPSVRRQAIQAIQAIHPGQQVMIPLLVKMLEDADPGVRLRILDAVADSGTAAIPGLIAALENEKADYWATLVLRSMGPAAKEAVPALTKNLKSPQHELRRETALTLGAIGEAAASAGPQLVNALEDPWTREAATFALGQIGSLPAGAEEKIKAQTAGTDKFLATISYWTLARIHPEDKSLQREATERIVERIKDADPMVRVAAARALAALPPAREISLPIIEKALEGTDEETCHHALDALAALGPAAVPRLIDALKHKNLQQQVSYVLGQLGPQAEQATGPLTQLVTDADPRVAAEAAIALGKIGPAAKSAVPALIAAMESKDTQHIHAIVFALGSIGPSAIKADPKLTELRKSTDRSIASISAWAITQLHPKSPEAVAQALPYLLAGLADTIPESRQASAEQLGSLGHLAKNAVPALEKATQDSSPSVRSAAANSLRLVLPPAKE